MERNKIQCPYLEDNEYLRGKVSLLTEELNNQKILTSEYKNLCDSLKVVNRSLNNSIQLINQTAVIIRDQEDG